MHWATALKCYHIKPDILEFFRDCGFAVTTKHDHGLRHSIAISIGQMVDPGFTFDVFYDPLTECLFIASHPSLYEIGDERKIFFSPDLNLRHRR